MKEIDGRTLWAEEMVSAEMGKESGERKPLWGVKCQNEQEGQHYPDSYPLVACCQGQCLLSAS